MNYSNTFAFDSAIKRLQVKELTILIAASVLLQFIIHLLPPVNGLPPGAMLLPIFYVPLIAVMFYKFHTAMVVAAFGPILNYFLTGNPKPGTIPLLTFEVFLFILILTALLKYKKLNKAGSFIAVLSALTVSPLVFSLFSGSGFPGMHLLISLKNAVPGIVVLVLLNILLLRLKEKL